MTQPRAPRLTRIAFRLLATVLSLGVVVAVAPHPAAADTGGRGFYIPGAFPKVSAEESLTFRAYMDDYTPVPKITVATASESVCTITGYDRATWNLTVAFHNGGTCTIWYEYTRGVVARSDIPVDGHRRQGIAVTDDPGTVPLSAGTTSFVAFSDRDHGPLDSAEAVTPSNGHDNCRVTGYDRTTYRVTVAVLRGPTCTVRLGRQQTDAYYATERTFQFEIADPRANQTIAWTTPARTPAWGDTPITLTGTSDSGLAVTYTSTTPDLCTVDGDTLHVVDAGALLPKLVGSCIVTATQAGNGQWHPADPVTRTIELYPSARNQSVTWHHDNFDYFGAGDGQHLTLDATSSSGRPVTYESLTPYNCTVSGNVATSKPGYVRDVCRVRATAAGAYGSWESASADWDFVIQATPRPPDYYPNQLVFPQVSDRAVVVGPFDVEAHGALPVTVSSLSPSVCTVHQPVVTTRVTVAVTPVSVGTCTLRAVQAQNQYQPAIVKDQSFQITAGQQTLDFPVLADHHATDDPFRLTATTSSGLPITFASSTTGVCTVADDLLTLHGTGTCTVAAEVGDNLWAPVSVERSFQVSRTPQAITFPAVDDHSATAAPITLNATATSGLPVAFTGTTPDVCTVDGDVVTFTGAGTCTVRAQSGNDLWAVATAERSFAVDAARHSVEFATIPDRPADAGPFDLTAATTSGLPVTFTSTTPNVCAVTGTAVTLRGVGTCTIRAAAGNALWATETVERSFEVTAAAPTIAPQVIDFSAIEDHVVLDDPFRLTARATSGLPVTFTSTTPAVCMISGDLVTLTGVGTCTVRAETPGNQSWAPASVERSFAVAAADQTIRLTDLPGVALSSRTVPVDAVSSRDLPVTLASTTPDVCSVTDGVVSLRQPGTCTVEATQPGTPHVLPAATVTASFPVWATPVVPGKTRLTQLVTGLGRGEEGLRLVASTETCRADGSRLVLVAPGVCRATVRDDEDRVVRRLATRVSAAFAPKATSHLTRAGTVRFAPGSAQLSARGKAALRRQATDLRDAELVAVYGRRGDGESAALSRARAQAVSSYLRSQGVTADTITVGLGAHKPAGDGNKPKTRRVTVFSLG